MIRKYGWIVAAVALMQLAGCSAVKRNEFLFGKHGVFHDRSNDYLQSQEVPPLKIPEGVTETGIEESMEIPPVQADVTMKDKFEAPMPLPLKIERETAYVRLDHQEDKHWLVVDAIPQQVWPQVRSFWVQNNITIEYEEPTQGILETGWLELYKPNEYKAIQKVTGRMIGFGTQLNYDRFRVWLEPGVKDGSTEVHPVHLSAPITEEPPTHVKWPEESSNKKLEVGLLNEMITFLSSGAYQPATVSLLAENLVEKSRVVLTRDANQYPILRMDVEYNRAWDEIGDALKAAGIQVDDLNRTTGTYYITYGEEEQKRAKEKPNWFKRVFRPQELIEDEDKKEPIKNGKQYLLKLDNTDNGVIVNVLIAEDALADVEDSKKLLTLIKENLI